MWLLDTNAWIAYLNTATSPIHGRVANTPPDKIFLCDVIKGELLFGAYNSVRVSENIARLRTLFATVESLPFDGKAAEQFGQIRAYLKKLGTPIGPYDLQIAAIALANGLVVVTHNTKEFNRVPNLVIEDWQI